MRVATGLNCGCANDVLARLGDYPRASRSNASTAVARPSVSRMIGFTPSSTKPLLCACANAKAAWICVTSTVLSVSDGLRVPLICRSANLSFGQRAMSFIQLTQRSPRCSVFPGKNTVGADSNSQQAFARFTQQGIEGCVACDLKRFNLFGKPNFAFRKFAFAA